MPRSALAQGGNGPVSVANGDFGSRFGWYVDIIKRKVDQNWYRAEVDPRTPKGAHGADILQSEPPGRSVRCSRSTIPAAARR